MVRVLTDRIEDLLSLAILLKDRIFFSAFR